MKLTPNDAMRLCLEAGCSLQTVYKHASGKRVRPSIAERIEKAIRKLRIVDQSQADASWERG